VNSFVCLVKANDYLILSFHRLFFVIEYVNGGDLMFHMQRQRKLPEEHARYEECELSSVVGGTDISFKETPLEQKLKFGH